MSSSEREQVRRQVVASRQRQGLPAHVQDISLLDRLAGRLLEQQTELAWAGNDDGATLGDQGRRAGPVAIACGVRT